jgi:hypothetical protein
MIKKKGTQGPYAVWQWFCYAEHRPFVPMNHTPQRPVTSESTGGLCNFQNAKEQQNTEALEAQLQQETRDHGNRARRVKTRARRYGRCGKIGHNIRICNINLESSEGQDRD